MSGASSCYSPIQISTLYASHLVLVAIVISPARKSVEWNHVRQHFVFYSLIALQCKAISGERIWLVTCQFFLVAFFVYVDLTQFLVVSQLPSFSSPYIRSLTAPCERGISAKSFHSTTLLIDTMEIVLASLHSRKWWLFLQRRQDSCYCNCASVQCVGKTELLSLKASS